MLRLYPTFLTFPSTRIHIDAFQVIQIIVVTAKTEINHILKLEILVPHFKELYLLLLLLLLALTTFWMFITVLMVMAAKAMN